MKKTINYPPRMPDDFDLTPFADALRELIPDKVHELMLEMDEAVKEYEDWRVMLTHLRARGKLDDFALWFWSYWRECRFVRYDVDRRWLNYWLDLYSRLPEPEFKRIPPTKHEDWDLDRIKRIPIENFYEGELRTVANRLSGKCPFHEERTPSFFIFTDDNHFHCFSCARHGSVIDYIMELKDFDFKQAIDFLK